MKTIICLTALLTVFGNYCSAQNSNTVRIVLPYAENNPPRYFTNGEQVTGGIQSDLLNEVFQEEGVELTFIPYKRALKQMKQKGLHYDCFAPVGKQLANIPGFVSKEEFTAYDNKVMVLDSNNISVNSVADLYGRSILSFPDAHKYLGEEYAKMTMANSEYLELKQVLKATKQLFLDRVDAVVLDEFLFRYHASVYNYNISQGKYKVNFSSIFNKTSYYIQCNTQAMVDKFDIRIRKLIKNSTFERIKERNILKHNNATDK